jgi:hypothetical protein
MGSLAPTAAHTVRVQAAGASGRRAQSRGTHEAEKWARGLEASSAPFDAIEDAEQLGGHREVTNHPPPSKLGGLSPESRARFESGSAQCDLDACSVQSEIMPCARTWHRTQQGPFHSTYEWILSAPWALSCAWNNTVHRPGRKGPANLKVFLRCLVKKHMPNL